ncbi:MAG: histidine kinase dimerization/phospho-acceptor domain-containing protein, partial [Pseudomonadota bacterium]
MSSSVIVLDKKLAIRYINPAAENLLETSIKLLSGRPLSSVMSYSSTLETALDNALHHDWSHTGQNVELRRRRGKEGVEVLHLNCTVTPIDTPGARLLLELWPIDQELKVRREERLIEQQQANRELTRNLAHEIRNPLGGIRGAAQLLEHELANPALHEYTQIIIKETDRLQDLLHRLLSPNRPMQPCAVNIHEILERVRSLLTAEFPSQLKIRRDYDTSLPELIGDREQLIQAI